jgi:hypothetical protein
MILNGSGVTNLRINSSTEQIVEHIEIGLRPTVFPLACAGLTYIPASMKSALPTPLG